MEPITALPLSLLPNTLAVCRLGAKEPIPPWAAGNFLNITRTAQELSIVCPEDRVPQTVTAERGWRAIKVEGPLDFTLIGILAELAGVFARARVSLFAISTYDTDYLLVKQPMLEAAIQALRAAGHTVVVPPES